MRTSVVVPCFNEQEVIEETHKRLKSALSLLGDNFEIIYVNDGSKDCTFVKLVRIAAQDQHVRVVSLSRNFGHQIALTAGLDYSTGDVTVIIDADLQDPPELIQNMIQKWREGYKIVYEKGSCGWVKAPSRGSPQKPSISYSIFSLKSPYPPKPAISAYWTRRSWLIYAACLNAVVLFGD